MSVLYCEYIILYFIAIKLFILRFIDSINILVFYYYEITIYF